MYTVWYSFRDSFTSFIIHMTFISFSCFIALLRTPSGRRQWQPTPVLLHGGSHGRRTLVGCSPWGCKESDMTERLHFHFSLSCIGEGNGNPLQCSCLENPRYGWAWWAAICGVAQSRTRLKRLSSSSNVLCNSLRVLPSKYASLGTIVQSLSFYRTCDAF